VKAPAIAAANIVKRQSSLLAVPDVVSVVVLNVDVKVPVLGLCPVPTEGNPVHWLLVVPLSAPMQAIIIGI
jgi:hypothetical protein